MHYPERLLVAIVLAVGLGGGAARSVLSAGPTPTAAPTYAVAELGGPGAETTLERVA